MTHLKLRYPFRIARHLVHVCLLISCLLYVDFSLANPKSDILLEIVQNCLNTKAENYCQQCRSPQLSANCSSQPTCTASIDVWSETSDFVAMRDIKMCGCPADFVHGLVLPKSVVTGVEDDRRPDGIWQFAWDVALQRIPVQEIALAVNPKFKRSQNQLHIHLVRLQPGVNSRLETSWIGRVDNLSQVWRFASDVAQSRHISDYGVLVAQSAEGGFRVALSTDSPEWQFTKARCTPQ